MNTFLLLLSLMPFSAFAADRVQFTCEGGSETFIEVTGGSYDNQFKISGNFESADFEFSSFAYEKDGLLIYRSTDQGIVVAIKRPGFAEGPLESVPGAIGYGELKLELDCKSSALETL